MMMLIGAILLACGVSVNSWFQLRDMIAAAKNEIGRAKSESARYERRLQSIALDDAGDNALAFIRPNVTSEEAENIPDAAKHTSVPYYNLKRELLIQEEFQDFIYKNQFPETDCKKRRIMLAAYRSKVMDGFTVELQEMGRLLQVGLASDRTFFVHDEYLSAYAPSWCKNGTEGGRWTCMFNPISGCTDDSVGFELEKDGKKYYRYEILQGDRMAGYGNQRDEKGDQGSIYFDTMFYGGERIVEAQPDMWKNAFSHRDVIPFWDRRMGRYWIRSQTVHFLWDTIGVADYLKTAIESRLPSDLKNGKIPYIGIHARFSDNIRDLARHFGRDAHITRNLNNFLRIADGIRRETGVSHIFLATDSIEVMKQLKEIDSKSDWTFWVQNDVQRAESNDFMWFKDFRESMTAMIATDIEGLRRADYLIGSFQSNVYRLAAELNTAYHTGRYSTHQLRHHTVDIEWYEDP